jgi:redox-sensing transcriptional repressor
MLKQVSAKTVGRLSLYRRLLVRLLEEGTEDLYSHGLAGLAGCTAAQVRRDIMATGYQGSPTRGYNVRLLIESIGQFLDAPESMRAAIVGVGNLGHAILAYFVNRRPKLSIVAAFDTDADKLGQLHKGCMCHNVSEMERVISEKDITLGIITVPASVAQSVADQLVRAGVWGILNFAPAPLQTPPGVYVEDVDMTTSLEKVAYFARHTNEERELSDAVDAAESGKSES